MLRSGRVPLATLVALLLAGLEVRRNRVLQLYQKLKPRLNVGKHRGDVIYHRRPHVQTGQHDRAVEYLLRPLV